MFEIQGVEVKQEGELVSLTALWEANGKQEKKRPAHWRAYVGESFIDEVRQNLGNPKFEIWTSTRGRNGQTLAHWQIALAYAKWLSPKLHMEVNRTFARAKIGDVTLADEIADKASPDDKRWLKTRLDGKVARLDFTSTLKEHGVKGPGYAQCTDAIYLGLMDKQAKQIREERGLKKSETRNGMSLEELTAITLAEMTAQRKIKEEKLHGNMPCQMKCGEVANKIKQAIA